MDSLLATSIHDGVCETTFDAKFFSPDELKQIIESYILSTGKDDAEITLNTGDNVRSISKEQLYKDIDRNGYITYIDSLSRAMIYSSSVTIKHKEGMSPLPWDNQKNEISGSNPSIRNFVNTIKEIDLL